MDDYPFMRGWIKHCTAWAALVAWLSASGLSWDLLQLTAYVNMSAANARTMDGMAALAKTLEDAPCPLCQAAREGRAKSDQSPTQKDELAKVKTKADSSAVLAMVSPTELAGGRPFALPVDESSAARSQEVPVPPPRA